MSQKPKIRSELTDTANKFMLRKPECFLKSSRGDSWKKEQDRYSGCVGTLHSCPSEPFLIRDANVDVSGTAVCISRMFTSLQQKEEEDGFPAAAPAQRPPAPRVQTASQGLGACRGSTTELRATSLPVLPPALPFRFDFCCNYLECGCRLFPKLSFENVERSSLL